MYLCCWLITCTYRFKICLKVRGVRPSTKPIPNRNVLTAPDSVDIFLFANLWLGISTDINSRSGTTTSEKLKFTLGSGTVPTCAMMDSVGAWWVFNLFYLLSRWFSKCVFVRLKKGDEYIKSCLAAKPPDNAGSKTKTCKSCNRKLSFFA